MGWEQLLAWVTGRVDEQLQQRVDDLVAENRILRGPFEGRLRLTDEQRITLATIGKKLGTAALEQVASIVTPETILAWHRKPVAAKFDTLALTVTEPSPHANIVSQSDSMASWPGRGARFRTSFGIAATWATCGTQHSGNRWDLTIAATAGTLRE
jgi:hypothetical protein